MYAFMKAKRFTVLNAFFIFAFLLAGISPACAFKSGQSGYLQICASDGSLKTIAVPERMDIYALYEVLSQGKNKPSKQIPDYVTKQKCGFCFFDSHVDKAFIQILQARVAVGSDFFSGWFVRVSSQSADFSNFWSRGPPLFI